MSSAKYISIIIPVYNVKDYLCECIDSIVKKQGDIDNYELILVDDGSSDGSGDICDSYADMDCVKVLHVKNGGPARARNIGLEEADGKYILFVDSDDYIAAESLGKIAETIKAQSEPDIVFLNGVKVYPDGREVVIESEMDFSVLGALDREGFFEFLSSRDKFHGSPCLKTIKRSLLIDNDIRFEEGKRVEDLDWSMSCFLSASSFGCYNDVYYYYRQAIPTSNSARFQDNSYRDFKAVINKWVELAGRTEYEAISNALLSFACYEYVILLVNCKDYVRGDFAWHKEMQKLLRYRNDKKTKLVRWCSKLIGIENTSRLLNVYLKAR